MKEEDEIKYKQNIHSYQEDVIGLKLINVAKWKTGPICIKFTSIVAIGTIFRWLGALYKKNYSKNLSTKGAARLSTTAKLNGIEQSFPNLLTR